MENRINFKIERELTDEERKAIEIIKKLQNAGFEAYFAGGAVRDELLNLPAHDIDIATSAKPEDIKKLFPGAIERGKAFGVMAVKTEDSEFEVAAFRSDIGINDHRRPEKVEFTTAEVDAQRRDFTINGLFYDPLAEKIIDYVGGIKDLKREKICFIGNAEERINEDYLRMLRAVRFSSKLNFLIDDNAQLAIKKFSNKINEVSIDRIRVEFSKILQNNHRDLAIVEMDKLSLLNNLLPELLEAKNVPQPKEFHSEGSVWNHILLALKNLPKNPNEELAWACILHDIAKPETLGYRTIPGKTSVTFFDHDAKSAEKAKKILERFKFSNHFIENVIWAISQHMRIIHAFQGMGERKQKKLFSDPNIQLLLDLTRADLSASLRQNGKPDLAMYQDALSLREKFEKETSEEEKKQVKKFNLITGKDIIEQLNIKPGPKIGKVKSEIEKAYLDGKINSKEEALKMLEKFKE